MLLYRYALLVFLLAKPMRSLTPENQVQTPFGIVTGNVNAYAREFLGIPYALPPVRFEPPVRWNKTFAPNGTLDARHFSFMCIQTPGPSEPADKMSENCLTLNIFSPLVSPASQQSSNPVMLWIHGGSLTSGSAMTPLYNGSFLAHSQKVVVVAINYRLNVFGFLPVKRSDGTVSVNNGFRDQQMAMMWVQDNIHAFGGDPRQVTIFGESAGGQSVGVQLVSPLSKGLFHRAIMESADVTNTRSLASALRVSDAIAAAASCSTFRCLQTINATTLLMAGAKIDLFADAAVVDGHLLPGTPVALVRANRWNAVPLVMGNNADESSLFVNPALKQSLTTPIFTAKQAQCAMNRSVLGAPHILAVLEVLYPLTPGVDNRQSIIDYLSDAMFYCGNRRFGLAAAQASGSKGVWMYSFKRAPACPIIAAAPGATHAAELEYVFQTTQQGAAGLSPDAPPSTCVVPKLDTDLSNAMASLWGRFARTGSIPAHTWPRFHSPPSDFVGKLDLGMDAQRLDVDQGYRRGQCGVLESLGISALNWHLLLGNLTECVSQPPL